MRPPSFKLSPGALLALPYRLCNPPAAAGNVRSCKVTPLLKVSLDDVLNKRHLPPLTLKDFEEWLLFVDGSPQYLYFILWLKEYEARYATWLLESGCQFSPSDLSLVNFIPPSPSLALFFTRAKQTFFDPASPYVLGPAAFAALLAANTPSTHSLSPSIPHFNTTPPDDNSSLPPALAQHPHPHPTELAPLVAYARSFLKQRLEPFVTSACHNVGSRRAWCGIAGGTFISLVFGILPTLIALFFTRSRWWRLLGWVGCWLGGTVIISSLHGLCMMIYLFGDLRQLHSFELARPSISGPHAIARARPRLRSFFTREAAAHDDVPPLPMINPKPQRVAISQTSTGTPVVHLDGGTFQPGVASDTTADTELTTGDKAEHEEEDPCIEISPAYYPDGALVTTQSEEKAAESASARKSVESVMRWVFGRRKSHTTLQQQQSDTGTFGVRSWSARGGLGSLPKHTDACHTAEFIPYEYAGPTETKACGNDGGDGNHHAPRFDFDKLPGVVPSPSCSIPAAAAVSTSASPVQNLHPRSSPPPLHVCTTPHRQPLPPAPPSLVSHPPPPSSLSPPASPASPRHPPLARQWWDTCPRHPVVEASLNMWMSDTDDSPTTMPTPTSTTALHPSVAPFSPSSSSFPSSSLGSPSLLSPPPPPPLSLSSSSAFNNTRHVKGASRRLLPPVPAFGPLTRVLSPVVSRGQWEIVVRSAVAAALAAWMLVGCVLAVPVWER